MAIKSQKEKKTSTPKSGIEKSSKAESKSSKKKNLEEDDLEEEEINDDWGKEEDDTNWDPDFEEFDVPKKSPKKPGKFKVADDDDDFSLNDDFKIENDDDLFDEKDELDEDY